MAEALSSPLGQMLSGSKSTLTAGGYLFPRRQFPQALECRFQGRLASTSDLAAKDALAPA